MYIYIYIHIVLSLYLSMYIYILDNYVVGTDRTYDWNTWNTLFEHPQHVVRHRDNILGTYRTVGAKECSAALANGGLLPFLHEILSVRR